MEKMPYTPEMDRAIAMLYQQPAAPQSIVTTDWKTGLPVLTGSRMTLRELRVSDASSLHAMLTTEEVSRFISPPPTTVEGFERFIMWANRERAAGNYLCFAIVPRGMDTAVGLFQVRQLESGWGTAEWGFALGSSFWGTGFFAEGADLVLEFVFETLNVHRLEARAAVQNGRGNGALQKLGAVREGVLRRSFLRNGQYMDQALWTILADDWRTSRLPSRPTVH
jgi:RimJ/RimL family protein N-acetyltransferase